MLIKKAADIRESEVTPKELFVRRRDFITAAGVTAAAVATGGLGLFGDSAEVSFAVHNTGSTIPADRLVQIFQPMQQVSPGPVRSQRSVGLGLYIVESILVSHHGTIGVTSTDSEGTTFTVRLPRLGSARSTAA